MNFLGKIIALTLLNFFLILIFVYIYNKLSQLETKILTTSKIISEKENKKISISPTRTIVFNSPVEQNAPEPATSPVDLSKCIIRIDSQQYNVTELRETHSGGDVFKCGTDMTSAFYSRHDASYLLMMEQYKIN